MSTPANKTWIVILQRSVRGPLTKDQIETLISEGILKRTDVASEVLEGSPSQKSDWKFIWQYPEFDRRKKPAELSEEAADRRAAQQAVALTQKLRQTLSEIDPTQIPPELRNIEMGDLVPHPSHPATGAPELSDKENSGAASEPMSPASIGIAASIAVGLVGVLIYGASLMRRTLTFDSVSTPASRTPATGNASKKATKSQTTRLTPNQVSLPERAAPERLETAPEPAGQSEDSRPQAARDTGQIEEPDDDDEDDTDREVASKKPAAAGKADESEDGPSEEGAKTPAPTEATDNGSDSSDEP